MTPIRATAITECIDSAGSEPTTLLELDAPPEVTMPEADISVERPGSCAAVHPSEIFGASLDVAGRASNAMNAAVQMICRNAAEARPKANDAAKPAASTSVPRTMKSDQFMMSLPAFLFRASLPIRSFPIYDP